jgi:hypothetical protein
MARIANRTDFKCYVLRKLGAPVIDLILETDLLDECSTEGTTGTGTTGTTGVSTTGTSSLSGAVISEGCTEFANSVCTQLDLAIDDAIDYFHIQGSNLGNEKAILYLTMTDQQHYYDVPECIVSIDQDLRKGSSFRFDAEESAEAVGLFSLQSQFGPRGTFSYLGAGGTDTLLTYEAAMQYNAMVDLRYTEKFNTEFLELEHKVFITPTPDKNDDGRIGVYICNIKVPDEKCFNHPWVQRYATALTMEQIGRNLSMYSGMQLPGGGEFNSAFYWDMGREDRDKLEEELFNGKWGNPPPGGVLMTG